MATGYEVQMYRDIGRIAAAAESIAKSLEKIANPPTPLRLPPPDTSWAQTTDVRKDT